MADNFHVTVKADTEALPAALELALCGCFSTLKVWGYAIIQGKEEERALWQDMSENGPRFILFRWKDDKATPFPAPLAPKVCAYLIAQWLEAADYGEQPKHDGDNHKGFFLTTGKFWDHIEGVGHAACAEIRPCWMMYGK